MELHALLPGMTMVSGADDHAGTSLKMIAREAARAISSTQAAS
jgi:hypothetical protein